MKQRPRIYYTESQKALMWERWQKGESLQQIAQLFDRNHSSIEQILAETGGIRPAQRRRSRLALTLAEREEISRAVVAGHSIRSIAMLLGRAPSTISREIKRNGGQECYRASQADRAAWGRAHRPKTCKLVENRTLAHIVAGKLQGQWSPEQIAGWLKRTYPDDETFQVSHETIYRSLFIQARGALKKELLQHLRRTRVMRRSRHHTQKTDNHGRIIDTVSISERPATVEDRAVPGHWEGVITSYIHVKPGTPLDVGKLEDGIQQLYGLDIFESVRYELVEEDGRQGLLLHAKEKSWGPGYLQAGIITSSNFEGDIAFRLGATYTHTQINALNGEWRLGAQIGDEPGIFSELFQPLDPAARYFVLDISATPHRIPMLTTRPVTTQASITHGYMAWSWGPAGSSGLGASCG